MYVHVHKYMYIIYIYICKFFLCLLYGVDAMLLIVCQYVLKLGGVERILQYLG